MIILKRNSILRIMYCVLLKPGCTVAICNTQYAVRNNTKPEVF